MSKGFSDTETSAPTAPTVVDGTVSAGDSAESQAAETGDGESTTSGAGPGFGAVATLGGLVGAGYLLGRHRRDGD